MYASFIAHDADIVVASTIDSTGSCRRKRLTKMFKLRTALLGTICCLLLGAASLPFTQVSPR